MAIYLILNLKTRVRFPVALPNFPVSKYCQLNEVNTRESYTVKNRSGRRVKVSVAFSLVEHENVVYCTRVLQSTLRGFPPWLPTRKFGQPGRCNAIDITRRIRLEGFAAQMVAKKN